MSPTGEPLVFDDAEVVQLTWETAGLRGHAVLPSALAPTSPLLLGVLAIRATGALGTVRAVLVRLSCRSGARARALTVGGWIDGDDEVVQTLTSSYAFPADRAAITIDRRYHVTTVRVVDGRELDGDLDLELREPEPIHPHDVQYVVGLQRLVGPDGERLASARTTLVSLDKDGKLSAMPEDLRAKLEVVKG